MSYPVDLDEYSEVSLLGELDRRLKARLLGVCDYCGRSPTEKPCRFLDRHNGTAELPKDLLDTRQAGSER